MHQSHSTQKRCSLGKFVMGEVVVVLMLTVGLGGLAQAMQPSEHRFVVLPPDKSDVVWVLDTTTGLRWQQEPGSANVTGAGASCNGSANCPWEEAVAYCAALGGGSRLAEVKELSSLVDYSQFDPALPDGSPFLNVEPANYWSASTNQVFPLLRWIVNFSIGAVDTTGEGGTAGRAWCAR